MTSMSSDEIREQVTSWIDEERRGVSFTTIRQSLGVPATQAQAVLEQLATDRKKQCHRVTSHCTEENGVPTTVFRLSSSASDGFCYAITGDDSILSLHERDMAQRRDLVKEGASFAPAMDLIRPPPAVASLMEQQNVLDHRPVVNTMTKSRPKTARPTTAAAFFQNKGAGSKGGTNSNKRDARGKNATVSSKSGGGKVTSKSSSVTTSSTTSSSSNQGKRSTKAPKEYEKENFKKNVGNADDFVGDLEDTDDEEAVVVAPARKRRPPSRKEEKVDEEPSVAKSVVVLPPVHGAMDAFAASQESSSKKPHSGRRRRKKLVETVTQDANGYIVTETKEVWEDIPSDEEAERLAVAKAKPKVTKKKTGPMKQGSLKGFFMKK